MRACCVSLLFLYLLYKIIDRVREGLQLFCELYSLCPLLGREDGADRHQSLHPLPEQLFSQVPDTPEVGDEVGGFKLLIDQKLPL